MIRLIKGAKPTILVDKAEDWTAELLVRRGRGEHDNTYIAGRYRHTEIKQALIRETHGKCAYCESKVLHIAFGDIEHIIPKSVQPELTFEWTNLTLACDICNTRKGAFVGEHARLVDPYLSEPLDHFTIYGPLIWAKRGDGDGKITEIRAGS